MKHILIRYFLKNITFTFVLLFSATLFAQIQDVKFERISLEYGLSQSTVNCILQDSKGFIWFGTQDGLNKFDGYKFTVFRHDPKDSTTLSSHFIWTIYEDRFGTIWIGTYNGLNKLDRPSQSFNYFQHDPENAKSLSHDEVHAICEDRSGKLWIGTAGGLNQFDPKSGTFIHFRHDPENPKSISSNFISSIYEDRTGNFWVGTGSLDVGRTGLNKFDRKTETFIRYQHNPANPQSLIDDWITSIHEDQEGNLWITTDKGLEKFDRETETFSHFRIDKGDANSNNSNYMKCVISDQSGNLWIGTWGWGLNRFDKRTGEFSNYRNDPLNQESLSNNNVISLFQDRSGTLWIGTAGGGLNKFNPMVKKFDHVKNHDFPSGDDSNNIHAIVKDRSGIIWLGTSAGLYHFDRDKNKIDPVDLENFSNNQADLYVQALYEDQLGSLWIGTVTGLYQLDQNREHITNYSHDPSNSNSLSHSNVTSIFENKRGALWIGTVNGLNQFDRKNRRFIHYTYNPLDPQTISNNAIKPIYEDGNGNLWIGTHEGLNRFDPESEKFQRYKYDPLNATTISSNDIISIYEDKSGIFWIGTTGGLNRFNREDETFTSFTIKDGLPNNVIHGIVEDSQGNLWLSSNNGLSRFDHQAETFRNYDKSDGLQSNEFNVHSYYHCPNGEAFFGGINGFSSFYPDSIKNNPYIPPIVLTDFKIFAQSNNDGERAEFRLSTNISELKEIKLTSDQNSFLFEFAALCFTNPSKNQYAYFMENFDKDWIHAGTRRFVNYTNLNPGAYTFRVKGTNNDDVWNEEGLSIQVVILPPWWRTKWAYVIYGLLFVAGVLAVDRIQRRRLIKREQQKAQVREAELRAKAAEAQARAIQAEHDRKTHELEEARRLQLSMLPEKLPELPNLDIDVYMKTAAEVGGDYYDFNLADDGTLNIAIGDATGHGLKAGIMVSAIKWAFTADVSHLDIANMFEKCTRTIKKMQLGNLFMALTLIKIKDNEMTVSSAGMPPFFYYRKATRTVDKIVLKGMPLGAFLDLGYEFKNIKLEPGDAFLFMSDGLVELFNENKEMFDYSRVQNEFAQVAEKSPNEIILHLITVGEAWCDCKPNQDDITFVVLKVKE